jgi:hypothetical protein
MRAILQIEHPVADFDQWRKAFDSDPEGRESSGVRSYRIMRSCEHQKRVLIDLEFSRSEQAHDFLVRLRQLWARVEFVSDPRARVVELVDEQRLAPKPTAAYP